MRNIVLVLTSVLLFSLSLVYSGCVSSSEYERVVKENEELQKQVESLKATVAKKADHKYELRQIGFRTWRFDPSDGSTCIALSTEADWRNKNTQAESCDCVDLVKDDPSGNDSLRKIYCGW